MHSARRARKWIGFTCKRASENKTTALGPLEKKKKKNAKWLFFTSRGAHVNCAIMAMLYTHSIGNQP